ncbi:hypothetical protein Ddc_09727 [Ditylenchus destructor]|nr:hypothetical protein Ddc_09727 [Ditylenchus destructor]
MHLVSICVIFCFAYEFAHSVDLTPIYEGINRDISKISKLHISHYITINNGATLDENQELLKEIEKVVKEKNGVRLDHFSHEMKSAKAFHTGSRKWNSKMVPNELLPKQKDPCANPYTVACYGLSKSEKAAFYDALLSIALKYIAEVSRPAPGDREVKVVPVGILVPNTDETAKHKSDTPFSAVVGVVAKNSRVDKNKYRGIAALIIEVHS